MFTGSERSSRLVQGALGDGFHGEGTTCVPLVWPIPTVMVCRAIEISALDPRAHRGRSRLFDRGR